MSASDSTEFKPVATTEPTAAEVSPVTVPPPTAVELVAVEPASAATSSPAADATADLKDVNLVDVKESEEELAKMSIQEVQEKGEKKAIPYTPHNGENRQYMRDVILGVNDGLVSMFLLVFGMAGGGSSGRAIMLAAITGAIAGAISMGLGEFIATKSQNQVVESDLALEKEHFEHHRDVELEELKVSLAGLGLRGEVLAQAVEAIGSSDEHLLKFMMAFEFGHTEQDDRNPLMATLFSGALFLVGALPSVIPFLCITSDHSQVNLATLIAGILCCCALFFVGAIKCIVTKANWVAGGMENLILGAAGAGISYVVGVIYDAASLAKA